MEKAQKDDQLLAGLGYKQEFKRAFSPLEVFGIAFSIIGIFPSLATTLTFSLPNGGPVSLVWGWTVCAFFIFSVALSLGELASAAPTSGGLYFWTHKYASPRWRNLLSWIVAYSNTMGLISGVASALWGSAVQLMAAVSIGSNLTFAPTTAQTFAVYVALLFVTGIAASIATRFIARLQWLYCTLNIILCLAIIIGLPAATPHEFKNPASYAFGGFENLNGWTAGFAFVLGFLAPLWTSGGFDGPIHMSEEASNASIAVPWAVVSSNGISLILGWGLVVSIAFSMGTDIESIMASPIGQPMATILFNSFGPRGTLGVWSIVVLAQFMGVSSALTSCSRQMFAFSRDGGLPLSRYLYRINRRTQTPVNCVWASIVCMFLLGLLVFAGPSAINAIFSLGVIGQYIAFGIPIASRFLGGTPWRPGPFTLGKLSLPVSLIALLWITFSVVIVMFPSAPNATGQSMNYAVVVGGGWIILCLIYYYFPRYGGRYWFRGPIFNVYAENLESEEKSSVSIME